MVGWKMAISEEEKEEIRRQARDEVLIEMRAKHLADSDAAYRASLGRLWAANGAGAGIIASSKGIEISTHLAPLVLFILGLLALSAGEIIELIKKWHRLEELEKAGDWLDVRVGTFEKPTQKAGYSLRNAQTISGIIAAMTFVIATLWALIKIA